MPRVLFHPLAILAVTMVSVLFFISLHTTLQKTQRATENITVLDQEIKRISDDISSLEKQVSQAESPEFKDKVIRNDLLMQKPGEYVVQLPPLESIPSPSHSSPPTPTAWESWRDLLW